LIYNLWDANFKAYFLKIFYELEAVANNDNCVVDGVVFFSINDNLFPGD
jgi:hypothetical protein